MTGDVSPCLTVCLSVRRTVELLGYALVVVVSPFCLPIMSAVDSFLKVQMWVVVGSRSGAADSSDELSFLDAVTDVGRA